MGVTSFCLVLARVARVVPPAFLAATALAAAAATLPQEVSQALQRAEVPLDDVSVFIQDVDASHPLLAHNADRPMNPASTMKLLTTYAALESLGPGHTWKTEVYAEEPVKDGVLRGNLVIKGYGDPRLDLQSFWMLTRQLRLTGLKEIRGDLVLDDSYFAAANSDPGGFDNRPYRAYNVGPEALLVHYRVVELRIVPDPEKNAVRVVADPVPGPLTLVNKLRLTHGPCNEWRDALKAEIRGAPEPASVRLTGTFSTQCEEKSYLLNLYDNSRYIHGVFRELWTEQGGRFSGGVRRGEWTGEGKPLVMYESPPLGDIVRDINKHSNNVMARQLLLTMGAELASVPGTVEGGRVAIRRWLADRGMDFPELVIENGSGLSRVERISARHLGELLLAAWKSPYMPEFIASLPIPAVDGTMKKRLSGSDLAGRAHIKTGLLEGVKTVAGYLVDNRGHRLVVVAFVNSPRAGASEAALDALLDWVYQAASAPPAPMPDQR